MNEEVNLKVSLEKDITYTSTNYANMYHRLHRNDIATRFFIVYYSVFSILYGLVPLYFDKSVTNPHLLSFLTMASSIIMLISSLLVSLANYPDRCRQVMMGLDSLKRMKKELKLYSDAELEADNQKKYRDCVKRYHRIVDNIELRTEIDYYCTCHDLREHDEYNSGWKNLYWPKKVMFYIWHFWVWALYLLIFVSPLIVLLFIF